MEGRIEGTNGGILAVARDEPDGRYLYSAGVAQAHGKGIIARRLFTWLLGFIDTDGVKDR